MIKRDGEGFVLCYVVLLFVCGLGLEFDLNI